MIELVPIGIIHSPYQEKEDAPPQGRMKEDDFEIEVFPEYAEGLKDIETASHLIVLYWLHQAQRKKLLTHTPWDENLHGVFATRSPHRPNPIAFDVVDLIRREENRLYVKKMDALDGSPLLDIKPYSSRTDAILEAKLAWLDNAIRKRNGQEK